MLYKNILFCLYFFLAITTAFGQTIKEADLAGSWYSDDSSFLSQQIKTYLENSAVLTFQGDVLALICPHAGIDYSGEVTASAFKVVEGKKIDTVIVVGFSHRRNYDWIAAFNQDGVRTPLGTLYTDRKLLSQITAYDKIFPDSAPFKEENSVELILPFIQTSLKNSKVLLLAIGRQSFKNSEALGEALYEVLKGKNNFLIIASTDMSHYLTQAEAKIVDAETSEMITQMHPKELFSASYGKNRMCGTAAVVATMIAAKKLGANKVEILEQSTSAKRSYDIKRVVGYLSAAFIKENKEELKESVKMKDSLTVEERKELLTLARNTITHYLRTGETLEAKTSDPLLKEVRGVFVTLRKGGELRGCIGNIIGRKPLYIGVRDMAIASSTQDPRFPAVREEELKDITIEISVLSPLKKISDPDEIILGTHGVLVKDGFRSGVYLPQVATETGWSKEEFMNSLCAQKAGMPPDAWKKGETEIYIFTAEVFSE